VKIRNGVGGLIFDIDGTLIDSNDLHAHAWQEAFEHFGKRFDYGVIREQMGKGGDLLVPDMLNAREIRSFSDDLKSYRKKIFKTDYMKKIRPFPGIRESFEELKARGIEIALGSSGEPDEVDYYIKLLEIEDLIVASTSKGDAKFSKPSPEIFEAAMERLSSHDGRIAAVGDTPYDILAGHRATIPVIAVLCGGFDRELLQKAEIIFDDVPQLVRQIEQIDDYFRV